jgi:hypothetical protein
MRMFAFITTWQEFHKWGFRMYLLLLLLLVHARRYLVETFYLKEHFSFMDKLLGKTLNLSL